MSRTATARVKPQPNRNALVWETFNQSFWVGYCGDGDGPVEFCWFDKTGLFELKNGIVVEVELSTHGTCDKYEGYEVRLNHRINGPITRKFFLFDDYLEGREDNRPDYGGDHRTFWVQHDRRAHKVDWYIAHPEIDDIIEMQTKIMTFIDHYGNTRPRR